MLAKQKLIESENGSQSWAYIKQVYGKVKQRWEFILTPEMFYTDYNHLKTDADSASELLWLPQRTIEYFPVLTTSKVFLMLLF